MLKRSDSDRFFKARRKSPQIGLWSRLVNLIEGRGAFKASNPIKASHSVKRSIPIKITPTTVVVASTGILGLFAAAALSLMPPSYSQSSDTVELNAAKSAVATAQQMPSVSGASTATQVDQETRATIEAFTHTKTFAALPQQTQDDGKQALKTGSKHLMAVFLQSTASTVMRLEGAEKTQDLLKTGVKLVEANDMHGAVPFMMKRDLDYVTKIVKSKASYSPAPSA
ncbi:MAG: hypothetical protein WAO98_11080 [Alphaproteobacteria bacterium]